MEKLKLMIPDDLKRMISESTPENLTSICSSLLDFFLSLPEFQRVVEELTDTELGLCRKSKESTLDFKRKGNECFSKRDYVKAINFYSQALRYAPMDAEDMGKNLVAVLYVNRASSMHNAGLLEESLRDCDRAIAIMPSYVKAWFRRGKASALLKNYEGAIRDFEVALHMENSTSGKGQIKEELEMILSYSNKTHGIDNPCNVPKWKEMDSSAERSPAALLCVSTPSKGRGMTSVNDIPPGSLVHSEEPLAAIVNKYSRETHCHFCFIEVPTDVVYCPSCTIPVYCSELCQEQARGIFIKKKQGDSIAWNLPVDLAKHVTDTISMGNVKSPLQDGNYEPFPEHKHECGGSPWSVVLPLDVVLAGRVLAKLIDKRRLSGETCKPVQNLVLAHNYLQIPLKSKLEMHIYGVVLSCCLKHHYGSDYPFTGSSVSQIRVGQALYLNGSFFNHSCQPNVHSYFLSRRLYLRTTEYVHGGYPLEISYGPQVGEWDLHDRQELLKEQYSFECRCTGCSQLNLSDLVLNAFKCAKANCPGAVTEKTFFDILEDDSVQISDAYSSFKLSLPACHFDTVHGQYITEVASRLLKGRSAAHHINQGCCLSCGTDLDIESSSTVSKNAMIQIQRLKECIDSDEDPQILISDFLKSLSILRSVRHQYSKTIAQAEDIIAEAFVRLGEFGPALQHCQESIEILKKLFRRNHIVIGNELIKLSSIQISAGDRAAALSVIKRIEEIFSLYYGSHLVNVCPHVVRLQEEVINLN
ncbi:uncharacterized protein LOC120275740 isoform X2 [Dioscorea cayenensis subsp. rotundata]|uniref:Uncharacterized protein LOC120275740 isoform X2 n=1 Tax=Dioscorea cayennensis subsp. rotundata TaxID=55577 RepID=A0AB40CHY5_DIOCR|nr:uncharacterized protein LOC120275740 isoform X2 [Dioscorea cayenensis subsp. rotundata]